MKSFFVQTWLHVRVIWLFYNIPVLKMWLFQSSAVHLVEMNNPFFLYEYYNQLMFALLALPQLVLV